MLKAFKDQDIFNFVIYLTITINLMLIGVNTYFKKDSKVEQILALKKLKYLLTLARSEAIKLSTKTYLCPTINYNSCDQNWNNNIMIFTNDHKVGIKILHFFKNPLNRSINPQSKLRFFSNNNDQKIEFLANGLTINNGHFCTDFENLYCIYINQAGKIYLKIEQ